MTTARIQDPEIDLDTTVKLGHIGITADAKLLVEQALIAAKRMDVDLELDPEEHVIESDHTEGNTRTIVMNWSDGCPMPLTMTFQAETR